MLAVEKYNYSYGKESVSPYVTAFYDAVLLYALALNETLEMGGAQTDGSEISRRMWNRSFEGNNTSIYARFPLFRELNWYA